jgi:Sperm-tail PG-rich repeat
LIGREAPMISIKGRTDLSHSPSTPGPGQYDPSDSLVKNKPGSIRIAGPAARLRDTFYNDG